MDKYSTVPSIWTGKLVESSFQMQVDFANDSLGHKEEQKLFVPRPFIAPGSGVSKIETMSQGILYGIYCAPMQTFL